MNRFVGPLLWLGLGLCAASGCAGSGPGRASGLAQRMPWLREKPSRHDSAREEDEPSRGTVSFRAPNRRARESSDEPTVTPGPSRREIVASAETRDGKSTELSADSPRVTDSTTNLLFAGHSSDRWTDLPRGGLPKPLSATASPRHGDSTVILAGDIQDAASSEDTTRDVVPAIAWGMEPLPYEREVPANVTTANYRSDRDALANPIQLQGVEALAPPTSTTTNANSNEPPLWASRPGINPVGPASGQINRSSQPGGRVQPVNAEAAPVVPPGPWQADIERLIARAERDVAGLKPGATPDAQAEYRRRQVHLRLLYLMSQRQEQALTAIPGLEPAEQEYWQQLCWAASNSLDAKQFPSPRDRAAQSIAPLNTALRRLREQSDLAIRNIAFCEQISYFGNYQKFARDEFTPGQEVLLYAEIENFNTEQTADGEHRTLLRSVIDIVGSNGEARWHKTFPATEDRCRNPRRDYFHNYQFAIPDRLPLGPHTLKLTVVDDLSGKQASYSLNFLVK